jgi:hypothetical protein
MKKAILITSVIEVDNFYPLTYSKVRSIFDTKDRLTHTIFTVGALDHICDDDTTIFLVDASASIDYAGLFGYQKNLVYVNVSKEFPELAKKIRTHPHKSHCETLLQLAFFEKYKAQLEEYDFFFKLSGRYFFDRSFNLSMCVEQNKDKFFFKHPLSFEWDDNWGYDMIDRRSVQQDNKLRQYCSVLYGWSKSNHERMMDIYKVIAEFTSNPSGMKYDLETLLYFFTREFEKDIIEDNWTVYGWTGVDGTFLRY